MKRSFLVASGLAALAALSAPALAHADATTLGWSYANVAVGTCSTGGTGCVGGHTPVYPHIQIDQGFNHNAVAVDTDPALGTSLGYADVGGGSAFGAPQ